MRTTIVLCLLCSTGVAASFPIGLSGKAMPIMVDEVSAGRNSPTVVLVGGLAGPDKSVQEVAGEVARYRRLPPAERRFRLLAISLANPDSVPLQFPPKGRAYRDAPDAFAIWRWIVLRAPGLVLVSGADGGGLSSALASAGIPTRSGTLTGIKRVTESDAHRALLGRLRRTPEQVARSLEPFYGQEFPDPVYVPGMALLARLRLGFVSDVERLGEPFASGARDSLAKPTASHFSGHLVFAELAKRSGDKRYSDLVAKAANAALAQPMDNEMSDSVFMVCPLLVEAGLFDQALVHFRRMQGLCLRPDGLYRHSPLSEAAWGRGNAFPALGLALALRSLPKGHAAYPEMLGAFQALVARLATFQDAESGMWHQVVDMPASYQEFSATAMIGRAMLLGVRNGWLDRRAYLPRVQAAWRGVSARTFADGTVAEVCESTGKQASVEDYLRRESIWARDPRGGGMALQFAVEMAGR